MLYDQNDKRLSPVHSKKPNGRRYRYYISACLAKGEMDDGTALRLPAKQIEGVVVGRITNLLCDTPRIMEAADLQNLNLYQVSNLEGHASELRADLTSKSSENQRTVLIDLVQRIHISPTQMTLILRRSILLPEDETLQTEINDSEGSVIPLDYPLEMKRRGVETKLIIGGQALGEPDPELVNLLATARHWYEALKSGDHPTMGSISKSESMDIDDVSRTLNLAFLCPSIVRDFIHGKHPVGLTVDSLRRMSAHLPLDWKNQRTFLGMQN